jgi:hypothetical protein
MRYTTRAPALSRPTRLRGRRRHPIGDDGPAFSPRSTALVPAIPASEIPGCAGGARRRLRAIRSERDKGAFERDEGKRSTFQAKQRRRE